MDLMHSKKVDKVPIGTVDFFISEIINLFLQINYIYQCNCYIWYNLIEFLN